MTAQDTPPSCRVSVLPEPTQMIPFRHFSLKSTKTVWMIWHPPVHVCVTSRRCEHNNEVRSGSATGEEGYVCVCLCVLTVQVHLMQGLPSGLNSSFSLYR